MDGVALLSQAREAGLKVAVENGSLKIRGPRKSAAVSHLLIANKTAVISALQTAYSANLGHDLGPFDTGTGTETPEIQASERVSGPANPLSHSFGGGQATPDRTGKRHRLTDNGFPARISEQPPAAIIATPVEICPRCNRGRVQRELRVMTGGKCWSCWQQNGNEMNGPQE
jgi:hypothetical protein